jgi:hypothetical protein
LTSFKGAAPARSRTLGMEKNIMMVLLFDFPILLAVSIPAAVIMAFILTNVVISWFKKI